MSQNEKLMKHFKTKGSISQLEALFVYGIARLASRIDELRKADHKIITIMKKDENGKRYARYVLSR